MWTGLWPLRPPPQPDELLTSWITRLAHGLGLRPVNLLEIVWPDGCDFTALDWAAEPELLAFLAKRTDQPVGVVAGMQLKLGGDWSEFLHQNWNGAALQFCPACLSEAVPYFRRGWRLAFWRVCHVHCLALLDACSRCGSAVRFDELFPADRGICLCRNCGEDLCHSQQRPVVAQTAVRLVELQQRLAAFVLGRFNGRSAGVRQGFAHRDSGTSVR